MPRKKTRNANGSHTIYYVENKKHWQGQICIGFKEDGRPNRKSVYGKTRKEVADKIKQIEYGIHTGTFTDKSEITIYHLAKQMIDESYNLNEIKDSTYYRHLATLKGLEPIYNTPLQAATVMQLKDFMLKQIWYSQSTINKLHQMLKATFKEAMKRKIITENPMDDVKKPRSRKKKEKVRALTVDEQKRFLEIAKRSHNYYQYALILETGLRTGELIGLTWDAVDLENRTLTINKTLEYRHKDKYWRAGPPKTTHSYRTIPLTNRATEILKAVKAMRPKQKKSVLLDQPLEYLDRSSGRKKKLVMRDLVFINWRTGEPAKNSSYDTHLYKLCEEAGIEPFCMHALRHTYATRAIESGMPPKVLQKLMGHASIKTTMDTYVHVTDESLEKAIALFEANPDLLTC